MTRAWTLTVAVLAGALALGLACGGEDAPSPAPTASPASTATATPSPSPSPTATPSPTPSPSPTATPSPTLSPAATATASATPAPTATATASATPAPTATVTPTPEAATATTLAVFSTQVSETRTAEGWERTRRVYALDIGAGTYWRVFDYPYKWTARVLTANGSILFADGERVRRFAPDGRDETTLYEGEAIHEISVSPDGAKVAVLQGGGVLTILDVATGAHIAQRDGFAERSLGNWSSASDRVAVVDVDKSWTEWMESDTAILDLHGALRVPPPDLGNLSPDFRHAIRIHIDGSGVASGFDVIELESGRAVHAVTAEADTFIALRPGWQLGPDRFAWFEMSRRIGGGVCRYDLTSRPREAGSVTAAVSCAHPNSIADVDIDWWEEGFTGENAVVGPRILNIASGAISKPARDEWRRMRTDATRLSTRERCGFNKVAAVCNLFYEGRPIWTGPALKAAGLIELDGPFAPRGVEVRVPPRPSAPQAPPARAEMAGPLLVWSEAAGHEADAGADGAERFHGRRRVMVHDAGTGRSWRAFDYRYPPPYYVRGNYPAMQVQAGRAGFTVWVEDGWNAGSVRHVSLEGRETTLVEHRAIRGVLLSPSGERVVVQIGLDVSDGAFLIFDLPSGRLNRRVARSDLEARLFPPGEWRDEWRGESQRIAIHIESARWSADETAISVVGVYSVHDGTGVFGYLRVGVLSLDGAFRPLPWGVTDQALSPDFRHIARGRNNDGEYVAYHWVNLDIVDVATGRVVRSVGVGEESGSPNTADDWGWTADGRFAWSRGYQSRASAAPDDEAEAHPVRVLDVRSGEIERVARGEHFADARASASCPDDDPVGRCAILLDGEVVGRGQWAEVIGVVALD